MSTRPEDIGPSAASERLLVEACVAGLSAPDQLVNVAALAGEPPDARRAEESLSTRVTEGSVVACIGVIERVGRFVGLVETLVRLSQERGATVVLAVPNHAAGARTDELSVTTWGDGAVAELRGLLPSDHVVLHELALRGAALVPEDGGELDLDVTVPLDQRSSTPVTFVLAFGPRAAELSAHAVVGPADLSRERAF
jgi:hypothetical protein